MSFFALAASALTLGFLHGLGADHLMAIAALAVNGSADRRRARVLRTAVGFAAGHAAVLGVGALLAVTVGLLLPAAVSSGAERAGGAMLVAIGAFGLWTLTSGRAYGHIHTSPESGLQGRWHMHLSHGTGHPARTHGRGVMPVVIGALFAVSSLRAVMLLQPFSPDASAMALPALLGLVALFGLGVLLSMSLFGVLLARVLSLRTLSNVGRTAAAVVAVSSILLGAYWMAR
jgi:nickel/cobalt transporter (NicO) family protein